MKQQLSPALLSLMGGIAVILLVGASMGYLFYNALQAPDQAVSATQYPTSILSSEFGPDGVFQKTAILKAPGGGAVPTATPTPLPDGSVGKQDLGSLE